MLHCQKCSILRKFLHPGRYVDHPYKLINCSSCHCRAILTFHQNPSITFWAMLTLLIGKTKQTKNNNASNNIYNLFGEGNKQWIKVGTYGMIKYEAVCHEICKSVCLCFVMMLYITYLWLHCIIIMAISCYSFNPQVSVCVDLYVPAHKLQWED